jgi:anti-sigma factor RsiW
MTETGNPDPTACATVRELVAWYPTGTLDADERRLVESHVSACAACAELLDLSMRLERSIATDASLHPEPESLTAYAEDRGSLPLAAQERIESHLESCPTCRQECQMLAVVEDETGGAVGGSASRDGRVRASRSGSAGTSGTLRRFWNMLQGSILRPVPAAVYLAAAVGLLLVVLVPSVRRDRSPIGEAPDRVTTVPAVGSVLLLHDHSSYVRGATAEAVPLPVLRRDRESVLMLEFTNLTQPPAADATYDVTLSDAETGAAVWEVGVRGALFADNYTLALTVDTAALPAGRYAVEVHGPERDRIFATEFTVR